MNRAVLEDREKWFSERLREQGKFEYIEGYVNMKEDVVIKHCRCGKTITQKAYTVMYNDIDKCYACDRHRRGYKSIKENIKHRDTIAIIDREKFKTRYRYKCQCRVCGELYFFNKKQLEEGIECCIGKTSRIERIVESKANHIAKEIRNNDMQITKENINMLIQKSYNDIALIKTCVVDTKKLFTNIQKMVQKKLDEKGVKNCPSCNRKIKNNSEWRIDFSNNKIKICRECKSKKITKK